MEKETVITTSPIEELASMIARRINFLLNDPVKPEIIFYDNENMSFLEGNGQDNHRTTSSLLENAIRKLVEYNYAYEQQHYDAMEGQDRDDHIFNSIKFVADTLFDNKINQQS